jgi:hypothetical protein
MAPAAKHTIKMGKSAGGAFRLNQRLRLGSAV